MVNYGIFEPRCEKTGFCICQNKDADQLVTAKLISAFVFATRIVQSLYFLNPKIQASSHLLLLYSLVCIGPGQKTPKTGFLRTRHILFYSKVYKTEVLLPTLQSVARRLGQGEIYEGIALDTDPLVMPKGASEIEVRAKQVGSSYLLSILYEP